MTAMTLADLRSKVQDTSAFHALDNYHAICREFLGFLDNEHPTRIVSPTVPNYVFFQYGEQFHHHITRPLNSDLFYESAEAFERAFTRFTDFLADLKRFQERATQQPGRDAYIAAGEINKIVYTMQQAIGAIGDSFDSPNQSRKRVGQLFEQLIRLIIINVGLVCEPRTVKIPIPGFAGYSMSYELDLVFSRDKAILTAGTAHIHPNEIVGSVKTTSKDRIDKIFLDKFLLSQLLQRHVPVVAIFLHDVQRASSRTREGGSSMFGVNSTFKRNHFLGYTVALNKLDGVYYVDPRPEMRKNQLLSDQIRDFQHFLITDLWRLSGDENNL
ncbi:MAG TPA: hypothetical protein VH591_06410 [Ktedonobacterales bacterium]|jgi:hypothetical protein